MDLSRLGRGETIAGAAAIALFIIMFLKWFGVDPEGVSGFGSGSGLSAWEAFALIDLVLLITIGATVVVVVIAAGQTSTSLPVAGSAIVAGLGALSALLVLIRIIFPPDFDVLGIDVLSTNPSYGVFLGLIASLGIAVGGWMSMQEEGTSFREQADRLSGDRPFGGPGA